MNNITQQEVMERFESLPPEMQQAISSDQMVESVRAIAAKYKVRMDRVESLIQEIGLIMLGFKKSHEFVKALSQKLEVDKETAESIAIDVDEQVFKKIRKSLQEVQYGDQDRNHFDGSHDMDQEEVGASPARDSLLKEVESHAEDDMSDQNPLASVSSTRNYDPSLFASAQTASGGSVMSGPTADPYREAPVGYEPVAAPAPRPTPFESHAVPVGMEDIPETQRAQPATEIDPSKTLADTLQEKIDPVAKATMSQDPYRESID